MIHNIHNQLYRINLMDLGNVSDLVSAGCNIAMTGAAIYAAWNARGWFSQRSHTKGFDKAEEILASIDEYALNSKKIIDDLHANFSLLEEIQQSRSVPPKDQYLAYKESEEWHRVYMKNIHNLIDELFRLERWALNVSNPGEILVVTNHLTDLHTSAAHFYFYCDACLYQLHNVGWSEFDNHFKILKSNYNDCLLSLNNLEKEYDKFKVKRFDHFFKLK